MSTACRQGAILLIVVGLSMIILTVTVSYVSVVRSDTGQVQAVLQDVQARAMLDAARAYIAECSRIGWSTVDPANTSSSVSNALANALPNHFAIETMGWNDIRNGAIGPIPRVTLNASGARIAEPQEAGLSLATGDSTYRIGRGSGAWPDLGSTVRMDLHVATRVPLAIHQMPNQRRIYLDDRLVPPEGGFYFNGTGRTITSRGNAYLPDGSVTSGAWKLGGWHHQRNTQYAGGTWKLAALRRADPLPLDTTTVGFHTGDPTPRSGTARRTWFRVYRETASDHDGNGSPWYDTTNLNGDGTRPPNGSVFVITCGAGGTMGFRNWTDVTAANASALFGSEAAFWDLRRSETILWYRTEWTAYTQQNLAPHGALSFNPSPHADKLERPNQQKGSPNPVLFDYNRLDNNTVVRFEDEVDMVTAPVPLPFGSFLWLQSLDREPPQW
ncbi:MAG: hypothetical protein PF961_07130 [Planctomycetota bacterium]|jgi:hypothetical protein|nr:hypothetical protein [Planctomycetota bacterium]